VQTTGAQGPLCPTAAYCTYMYCIWVCVFYTLYKRVFLQQVVLPIDRSVLQYCTCDCAASKLLKFLFYSSLCCLWTCLFTAACAIPRRVCSVAACAIPGRVSSQQPVLPLDVSVLQQPVLPLDVSVLQQPVLPLDVSVL
jgi:hypothetical protein